MEVTKKRFLHHSKDLIFKGEAIVVRRVVVSMVRAKSAIAAIVVVVIVIAIVGVYLAPRPSPVAPSTSTTAIVPSVLTYETTWTPSYLDPALLYDAFGVFTGNVYENLFWFNGSSTTDLIPWLAQSYEMSPDFKTYGITLRNNIPTVQVASGFACVV
jgi:ABC-type transport system substrate-binding protein